jgi:hypothetical protein
MRIYITSRHQRGKLVFLPGMICDFDNDLSREAIREGWGKEHPEPQPIEPQGCPTTRAGLDEEE